MKNLVEIVGIIQNSELLSEEEKSYFIYTLKEGEPFKFEFIEEFKSFIEKEKQYLEDKELKIIKEQKEAIKAKKEAKISIKKLPIEHAKIVQKVVIDFEENAKKMSADYDQKIETIIKEKGEQSEIDAIKAKLQG